MDAMEVIVTKKLILSASILLIVGIIAYVFWPSKDKIDVQKSAYMYSPDQSFSSKTMLIGTYDKKKHSFQGTMTLGNEVYSTVLLSPGSLLISYEGANRRVVGPIFYDEISQAFALQIHDKDLYMKLTHTSYNPSSPPLILAAPVETLEEAKQLYARLSK
ncbi:hypothetical protein J2Z69_002514 [Paenibacillus shirakamiensis]|uniref:Bacterial Pleckstrin homology domain-containing protein n=1 Tax=Paenibacillus shirakamiensis TaxID=1265935 RepID=A0ABS4JIC5_9BACL|nr:hypothetical protein [Paenibacillus shirakamiensis]MBP2001469.1 hypothetical protein [Paenibacillus shirakamiensis]